jgi:hypothetical protein
LKNTVASAIVLAATTSALHAQNINDQLVLPPPAAAPMAETTVTVLDPNTKQLYDVPVTRPFIESLISSTEYLGRAALIGDDTRLASFSKGGFLPSAIPVAGQPFFGSDSRVNLQGSGSAVRINGYAPATAGVRASAHAQLIAQDLSFGTADAAGDATLQVRQVFATFNRLSVGVMDSAFSDPSAVPEVLDVSASPSARITVHDAGLGSGQGRLSYDLLSDEPDGLEIIASIEQALPEVSAMTAGDQTFAHYPDFVGAAQYVVGDGCGKDFVERWHLQAASVLRDLGVESPGGADQSEFGWGSALSGAYRFKLMPSLASMDRVMFSVAYGEGISHYIADLNAAADAGDAAISSAGVLEPLPVLAWYAAFTHNWNDVLRSTATYSQVSLDSTTPQGAGPSPYRIGDYIAVNLLYHRAIAKVATPKNKQNFFTGVEYLFGRKETLNSADGDANRLLWVIAISK